MKCSKISWAASFDLPLKFTKAANINHDILNPDFTLRWTQAHLSAEESPQPAFGASFASIATSSPMEVRTMTSKNVSESHTS